MADLIAQKRAHLESELGEVRYQIKEQKDWGYDQIEFDMAMHVPFKIYATVIIILFVLMGSYEELTGYNTSFNKWMKAKLGHKDFH